MLPYLRMVSKGIRFKLCGSLCLLCETLCNKNLPLILFVNLKQKNKCAA